MAKVSKIAGIDAFLRSTESKSVVNFSDKKKEELTLLNFQLPVSLKKKMSKYCIENDLSMRRFLTGLIEEKLKK